MSLSFSGAFTSSPVKRRLRSSSTYPSPDVSLLSPDSSYVCYSAGSTPEAGVHSRCCRRSPRLLTNGYYTVTDDSFLWDEDGTVLLTPCAASVSYKETVFRVFRRRRRKAGGSLARLLSDVSKSCQTWLDSRLFGGVFRTSQDLDQDLDPKIEQDNRHLLHDQDQDAAPQEGFTWPQEQSQSGLGQRQADNCCSIFTYDPSEVTPPPDKEAAPRSKQMIQEEICSEIYQSSKRFDQALGELTEFPPPSVFYASACRQPDMPHRAGLRLMSLLALVFVASVFVMLGSGCPVWSAAAVCVITTTTTCLCVSWWPRLDWRGTKTEDITSRNE
ncbi:transmembrane protein 71 [Syngnathus acus]|uniref:transmembrane protein 71 n=1 Tax=Syngnathus acus TaxID=161584 RepID=UPI001885B34C|nr:transmembrane protein 71 [Syngnathus acus]